METYRLGAFLADKNKNGINVHLGNVKEFVVHFADKGYSAQQIVGEWDVLVDQFRGYCAENGLVPAFDFIEKIDVARVANFIKK